MSELSFGIANRQREKEQSRLSDEARLESGQQSAQEVAERNGFFSPLDPSRAKISKRRIWLQLA